MSIQSSKSFISNLQPTHNHIILFYTLYKFNELFFSIKKIKKKFIIETKFLINRKRLQKNNKESEKVSQMGAWDKIAKFKIKNGLECHDI